MDIKNEYLYFMVKPFLKI